MHYQKLGQASMFEKFFQLRENPFLLTIDPAYLFLGNSHEEALAHLNYGISQGDGFILITGDHGVGKTTVCRAFIEGSNNKIHTAYVLGSKMSSGQLLKKINDKFGITSNAASIKDSFESLNSFLLEKGMEGKKVVLFIDEAQNLSKKTIEQVRLLSNLETTQFKLLHIVLIGQPKLANLLKSHQLRQIGQRISVSYHMTALTLDETKHYIFHRIRMASPKALIDFDRSAIRWVFRYSKGYPRSINKICNRAFLTAYRSNEKKITADMVRSAIGALNGKTARFWDNLHVFLISDWKRLLPFGLCILILFFTLYNLEWKNLSEISIIKRMAVTQKMPELKSGNITAPVQQLDKEYKNLIRSSLSRLTSTKRRKSSLPVEDNRLPKATHSVQVGAFLAKENADVRVAKLTERGYKPKIVVFNDSMGRRWYTVRIGNYASREIAQKRAKAFSKREKFESAIVPVDAL